MKMEVSMRRCMMGSTPTLPAVLTLYTLTPYISGSLPISTASKVTLAFFICVDSKVVRIAARCQKPLKSSLEAKLRPWMRRVSIAPTNEHSCFAGLEYYSLSGRNFAAA